MLIYSRLIRERRYTIEAMSRKGYPQIEIAKAISKQPSTVSHVLRLFGACRDYCFVEAQRDAESETNGGERLLGICFWREAPETAIEPVRTACKMGGLITFLSFRGPSG